MTGLAAAVQEDDDLVARASAPALTGQADPPVLPMKDLGCQRHRPYNVSG